MYLIEILKPLCKKYIKKKPAPIINQCWLPPNSYLIKRVPISLKR